MKKLLFICTANYYRSRFAEALFNYRASRRGLAWNAFSRGISPSAAPDGLSPHAINGLKLIGVPPQFVSPEKTALVEEDFALADRIIALQRTEHEPMLRHFFPGQVARVEFWEVADVGFLAPAHALLRMKEAVDHLVEELAAGTEESA